MEPETLPEESKAAVHAARDAAQALELSRQAQLKIVSEEAAHTAANLAAKQVGDKIIDEQRMAQIVREQITSVLSSGSDHERELILARVPYICNDIKTLNTNMQKLVDMLSTYPIVQRLVFGGAGMILTAVVGALIYLVVVR